MFNSEILKIMEKDFVDKLKEVFEIENRELQMNDQFRDYDEWDSLVYLSVIAMFDEEYDIQIEEADFKKLRTVNDLFNITNVS